MRIALVSGELYPCGGGGIGQFVNAAARALSPIADVLVLTSSAHEDEYRRLRAAGDQRLPPPEVSVEFVPEPAGEEGDGFFTDLHCYSARVYDRLRELYGGSGPDIIEFADYLAEGYVTVQAARTLQRFLARTQVCVRVHTSHEMCTVLDGCLSDDFPSLATYAMERYVLAYADRLIWQGGDILGTYRRFYGETALTTPVRIRYPFCGATSSPGTDRLRSVGSPLRLLYLGRLERRKGIQNLVTAASALDGDDWCLSVIGDDTDSAPLGGSMYELLDLARGDDGRIQLRTGIPRELLWPEIATSDVIVVPSLWECWPYVGLESLHLNRPLLATPTGGLTELVQRDRSGWLTEDASARALERGLRTLIDDPSIVEQAIRADGPRTVASELAADREVQHDYRTLAAAPAPRAGTARAAMRRPGAQSPTVSAVVPYYRAHAFVEAAVRSLATQTHPRIEVILVNDGSFTQDDEILSALADRYPITVVTQPNTGLGAARNFGVSQCRGTYIVPLDSDNALEPDFIARCVHVLENRLDVAYVTAWSRYVDVTDRPLAGPELGYQPFGNHHEVNRVDNVAGDAVAVIRRRVFDLGLRYSEELASYEDWHFYRRLQDAGQFGAVIPERLIRHRIRPGSMLQEVGVTNRPRLEQEIAALLKEDSVRWTP